jgi:ribosome-associated translation inhibitor RaiA
MNILVDKWIEDLNRQLTKNKLKLVNKHLKNSQLHLKNTVKW